MHQRPRRQPGEGAHDAMHEQRRASSIQQRTWTGQLDDALAELYCAQRGVSVYSGIRNGLANGVLVEAECASPTPLESLTANLFLRADERILIASLRVS